MKFKLPNNTYYQNHLKTIERYISSGNYLHIIGNHNTYFKQSKNTHIVSVSENLNRQLNIDLPESSDYHTLAGYLLERFQQVPSKGDYLLDNGINFEITALKGPRIEKVKVTLPQKTSKLDL